MIHCGFRKVGKSNVENLVRSPGVEHQPGQVAHQGVGLDPVPLRPPPETAEQDSATPHRSARDQPDQFAGEQDLLGAGLLDAPGADLLVRVGANQVHRRADADGGGEVVDERRLEVTGAVGGRRTTALRGAVPRSRRRPRSSASRTHVARATSKLSAASPVQVARSGPSEVSRSASFVRIWPVASRTLSHASPIAAQRTANRSSSSPWNSRPRNSRRWRRIDDQPIRAGL